MDSVLFYHLNCLSIFLPPTSSFIKLTRELPGVALVALFHIFSQSFKLNCWNNHFNSFPMHGFPSCLGQYLEVECLNWNETNFSRTTQSQRFWQGVIWHVWTSQFDKHWRHSQKERLAYKLVDANWHKIEHSGNNKWHFLYRRKLSPRTMFSFCFVLEVTQSSGNEK